MPAPGLLVVAEIASQCLDAPRHLRGRNDRRKGAGGAVAIGMAQCDRQCAVTAHRMTEDGLPVGIDGKMRGDQFRQFFRDITPHAVVARERRLRGVDIKAGAEPEIVGAGGIAGHFFAARAGVGCDEDQSEFGAGAAEFTFFRDVGVGAGQARQIPDHRQLCAVRMGRDVDRKGHVGPGLDRWRACKHPAYRHAICSAKRSALS